MFEFQSVRRSFPRNLAENSEAEASWIFLFHWNFDFSSNHSIISISQFEFLSEKFFVCVNSYLPWNYFNVSIFRWSWCHFYEIIHLLLCFFSGLYFPPTNSGENIRHSQKWWVPCSFAYLRWRRRDVCNFYMIYIDDIIHNCMCVIFWTWKWYIESSWIKWNKN